MSKICPRNCHDCQLQPTIEAKQICASFNAIQILAFLENKIVALEERLNAQPEIIVEETIETPIVINETAVYVEPIDYNELPDVDSIVDKI